VGVRVLIAEDDMVSRSVLETLLKRWGHEVVAAEDGQAAWEVLRCDDSPRLAILDWMMPGLDGTEVCRLVRALPRREPPYLILLTARDRKEDVVAGLESGADDYLTKPFDRHELHARVRTGARMVELQRGLAQRVRELEEALAQVKQLKGLLPICAYCKRIRDDRDYWHQVESYITAHSDAHFSHGICPSCWRDVVEPQISQAAAVRPQPPRG
jgi:phosphoserine phosphatase RsbU/P